MKRTLYKYISYEIWSIFTIGLIVFAFIVMATRVMGVSDLLIGQRIHPVYVIKIILCLVPRVILFSLPAACLMSVLLAFIRFSSDNELTALYSSGIGLHQIMPAVFCFSLINMIIAGFLTTYAVPLGNRSYRNVVYDIITSKSDFTIRERVFEEPIDNLFFYVNSFSARDKTMKDLIVIDRRNKMFTAEIIAEKGIINTNPESNIITLRFTNGNILTIPNNSNTANPMVFDTLDYNIDLKDIMSGMITENKEPGEMFIGELIANLKITHNNSLLENMIRIRLFEMFSIPIAIFLLGIAGVPLGAHFKSKGRVKGIIISIIIFLVYYNLLILTRYTGENGLIAPHLGVWIPDIFLLVICVYLYNFFSNNRPFSKE